jgi:hypothetical protein
LFTQVLKLAHATGLVQLGLWATDGSKLPGNAPRHKTMSYGYLKKEEERLQAEIKELLAQTQQADEAEDAALGARRGDELPEELRFREERLARIQQAKGRLEQQARDAGRWGCGICPRTRPTATPSRARHLAGPGGRHRPRPFRVPGRDGGAHRPDPPVRPGACKEPLFDLVPRSADHLGVARAGPGAAGALAGDHPAVGHPRRRGADCADLRGGPCTTCWCG